MWGTHKKWGTQSGRARVSLWLDNQGRVRPGWRFLLGAVVAVIANFIAIGVAGPLAHGKTRLLEALYRPLTLLLLLGGYALLLMSADQVHERLFSAMGLGKFPGWVRQALWGVAIGTALTVVAVLWIVISGNLRAVSFKHQQPHARRWRWSSCSSSRPRPWARR